MATNGQINEAGPSPLPSAPSVKISESLTIQPPLSRLGRGPGLILVIDKTIPFDAVSESIDPPPLKKWAEEGYVVVQVDAADSNDFDADLKKAIATIKDAPEYDNNPKFGIITYLSKADPSISSAIETTSSIHAVISYGASHPSLESKPHLLHSTNGYETSPSQKTAKVHVYPTADSFFVLPSHAAFHSPSASVSHTRTLTWLKPLMGGPYFDLEAIWEEHCLYEFGERAVEKTMATMVQEPYVNHIPTMTGGVGRERLTAFYANHFIFNNPDDTRLELVSRTVGVDRVIDEFVFGFTHDRMIDWLIPGIPPTGKHVRIPFTSIVNIRGDRLYHEHIAWDQASILVQLGLMPDYLPFPYQVDGKDPAPGKRFEYRVPAAGVETAIKLTDENAVASNHMFGFGVREVDDV